MQKNNVTYLILGFGLEIFLMLEVVVFLTCCFLPKVLVTKIINCIVNFQPLTPTVVAYVSYKFFRLHFFFSC